MLQRDRVKSEELQLDKQMPSRKALQGVKQAGGQEVPTHQASISKIRWWETGQRRQE